MRWTAEQYMDLLTHREAERPMLTELFGTLVGLDGEWRNQGASENEISLDDFELDYVEIVGYGGTTGIMSDITPRILEDNSEYRIEIDNFGRRSKLIKNSATIPLPLDHPVTDMDSWLKLKHWFTFNENRINWGHVESAKRRQEQGALVCASIQGGFDLPRQLMGEEGACICYYDDPELMMDMLNTAKDTAVTVLERICDKLRIDNLSVHEDLAGKSGSLIGPNIIEEFIKPYYLAAWDIAKNSGARLFSQDSDGNMVSVLDSFVDAGINVSYPCEPGSGMDIISLHEKYQTSLGFKGGIDKYTLRDSKEAIRKELEYKLQLKTGVVFGLDHRIPNGVPIENYRYYIKTAKEILGIKDTGDKKFVRMAF